MQIEKEQVRALLNYGVQEEDTSFPKGGTALIIPFNFRQKWNESLSIIGTCLSPPDRVLR